MDRKGQTWKDGSGAIALVLSTRLVPSGNRYHDVLILECPYDPRVEGTQIMWSEAPLPDGSGNWSHKRSPMKQVK